MKKWNALAMAAVALGGLLVGRGVESAAAWHLWSDPATWNGHLPAEGADVIIPAGKRIVLDVSPPPLHSLNVNGSLRFADKDLALRPHWRRCRRAVETRTILQRDG